MTCSTCRNFRRSVAGQLGYCAMDRTHSPLSGDEIRACWQAPQGLVPEPGSFADMDGLLPPPEPRPADLRPPDLVEQLLLSDPPPVAALPVPGTLASVPKVSPRVLMPVPPLPPVPDPAPEANSGRVAIPVEPRPARAIPVARNPVEGREGRVGGLVEAPLVVPSGRIISTADRRRLEGHLDAAGSAQRPEDAPLIDGEGSALLDRRAVG